MNDFVLPRQNVKESESFPTIRITQEAYELLIELSKQSGLSFAKIASKAISYAYENVLFKDE